MVENNTEQQGSHEQVTPTHSGQMNPFIEALVKHQKNILFGAAGLIVAAAIYAGFNTYSQKAEGSATAKLGTILIETSGDEKIAQLEQLLGDSPSSVKPAVLIELAQTSMVNAKYDKAVEYWDKVAAETGSNLEFVAQLGKAKCLTMGGKAQEALAVLQSLSESAPESFVIPLNRQLAVAAEQAQDEAAALAAYEKLAQENLPDKQFIEYKVAQLKNK